MGLLLFSCASRKNSFNIHSSLQLSQSARYHALYSDLFFPSICDLFFDVNICSMLLLDSVAEADFKVFITDEHRKSRI